MANYVDCGCVSQYRETEKTTRNWKQRITTFLSALHIEGAEHLSKTK